MGQDKPVASAQQLTEEQEQTVQDPQVEVTHPDTFARRQYESETTDPDALSGSGNNPTAEQGGVGAKTEDMDLDPSHSEDEVEDEE